VSSSSKEQELGRLFEELRRSEEATAPEFRHVLARARARRTARRAPAWRFAAAAVSLVVIAAALLLAHRPAREIDLQAVRTLTAWTAPTDSLLRTPGSELLDSIPRLAMQVPDYSALDAAGFEGKTTPRDRRKHPQ
jgi:hypothetical protein